MYSSGQFIENTSVHKNLSYIPGATIDDNNQWLKVISFCKEAGVDSRNIIRQMKNNKKWNKWGWIKKDERGHWWIRLKAATKFIENYRYGKLGTKNGQWWSEEEIEILNTRLSHKRISEIIGRNITAIKVKRSKLNIHRQWLV